MNTKEMTSSSGGKGLFVNKVESKVLSGTESEEEEDEQKDTKKDSNKKKADGKEGKGKLVKKKNFEEEDLDDDEDDQDEDEDDSEDGEEEEDDAKAKKQSKATMNSNSEEEDDEEDDEDEDDDDEDDDEDEADDEDEQWEKPSKVKTVETKKKTAPSADLSKTNKGKSAPKGKDVGKSNGVGKGAVINKIVKKTLQTKKIGNVTVSFPSSASTKANMAGKVENKKGDVKPKEVASSDTKRVAKPKRVRNREELDEDMRENQQKRLKLVKDVARKEKVVAYEEGRYNLAKHDFENFE